MTPLDLSLLDALRADYRAAPSHFHATRYWESYEESIAHEVARLDPAQIDSGLYPYLATFGFGTVPYARRRRSRSFKAGRLALDKLLDAANRIAADTKAGFIPYGLKLDDLYALALAKAELAALRSGARPPSTLEAPAVGAPQDAFEVDGRRLSVSYLDYYLRYCFVHGAVGGLRGDEVIVEIGSGSGKQAAVLKQLLPDATILCFDLPLQLFLAYHYTRSFMPGQVVGPDETRGWTDLSGLRRGKIHFFGNWQMPLASGLRFDLFWNAASFGEMEPAVVQRYLSYVSGAEWIYLMQARHGKETGRRRGGVEQPQTFDDYCRYLPGYVLQQERLAQGALKPYRETGGYFEAVWRSRATTEVVE